jgi:hypothetical protein
VFSWNSPISDSGIFSMNCQLWEERQSDVDAKL